MTKITEKILYISACTICIAFLSACSSLALTGQSEDPQKANFDANAGTIKSEFEVEIEDFKAMKSSLTRLVSIESDLSFLLDEMSRFNEQNPIMYDTVGNATPNNNTASKAVVEYSPDGKTEYATEEIVDGWAKSLGNMDSKWDQSEKNMDDKWDQSEVSMDDKWDEGEGSMDDKWRPQATEKSNLRLPGYKGNKQNAQVVSFGPEDLPGVASTKFSSSPKVEVAAAKPVLQMNKSPQATAARTVLQRNESPRVAAATEVNPDKFSYSSDPTQIVGELSKCNGWKVDSVKTYSLHLASYKSRKAAEDGWSQLNDKYADIWCETEAKLAKVVVKGTEYLSLRVGGYDSKDKVLELCSIVKQRGDYCAVSTATGETLP